MILILTMTPKQRKQANKLIRNICCNYNNGHCLLLDDGEECVCVQSISYSVICNYFKNVLLMDVDGQALKAEIYRDSTLKHCVNCGKTFSSKSNHAKYCKNCALIIKRQQKAKYARKMRSRVEK